MSQHRNGVLLFKETEASQAVPRGEDRCATSDPDRARDKRTAPPFLPLYPLFCEQSTVSCRRLKAERRTLTTIFQDPHATQNHGSRFFSHLESHRFPSAIKRAHTPPYLKRRNSRLVPPNAYATGEVRYFSEQAQCLVLATVRGANTHAALLVHRVQAAVRVLVS